MTRQEQNENDHFFSFFELSEEFPSLALFFFFPVDEPEMEKMGTLKPKWGPNGDQKTHFGPHGDQSPQMGTNVGAV